MYSDKITSPDTLVKLGVGVIIIDNNGRILLEKRTDNAMWGLPGGVVEPGESVKQTAIREVKEETNLDVKIIELIGVYSDPRAGRIATYPDNGDVRHLIDVVVMAEIISGILILSEESLDLKFFKSDCLPIKLVAPAKQPLQDFLNGFKSVIR